MGRLTVLRGTAGVLASAALLAGLALMLSPTDARAATFIVDSASDTVDASPGDGSCADVSGNCTLRAAVMEANALAGPDQINIPAGTYLRSIAGFEEDAAATGDLDVTDDLTLVGDGAATTVIDAQREDRIFDIHPDAVVEIRDLTITNGLSGFILDPALPFGEAFDPGGGILNHGDLTLKRVALTDNWGRGAAVWSAGEVSILDGRLEGNDAGIVGEGQAIINLGMMTIRRTSIANNPTIDSAVIVRNEESGSLLLDSSSIIEEGIFYSGPALVSEGVLTMVNSTVSGTEFGVVSAAGTTEIMHSTLTSWLRGLGVADGAVVTMANTILTTGCGGPVISLGHNIVGPDLPFGTQDCLLTHPTDRLDTDPLIGPLADNGGPTLTHALLPGSPALDAVPISACVDHEGDPLTADQRGVARPQGRECDIGAFEAVQVPLSFTVDSTADRVDKQPGDGRCADQYGGCTFRAAVMEANTSLGRDTIHLPAGTYQLTLYGFAEEAAATGDLDITDDLILLGAGAGSTIIDAEQVDENIFDILGGPSGPTVEISGVTVQNGRRSHDSGSASGGGIRVGEGAALELRDSVVRDNTATNAGGGISSSGMLTVIRSTFVGNHSSDGGGISGVGATVVDSLLTGNVAEEIGDAISGSELIVVNTTVSQNGSSSSPSGAINVWGSALIVASTVAANNGAGVLGFDGEPSITFRNTVIANNGTRDCSRNIAFPVVSLGHNLDSDDTCGLTAATDQPNTDPLLGPLEDNGGPTLTHALLPGSPAINGVPLSACLDQNGDFLALDQRGESRPQGFACDIGAFELAVPGTIGDLRAALESYEFPNSAYRPLDAVLRAALRAEQRGDTDGVSRHLERFIRQVDRLRSRIGDNAADALHQLAQQVPGPSP